MADSSAFHESGFFARVTSAFGFRLVSTQQYNAAVASLEQQATQTQQLTRRVDTQDSMLARASEDLASAERQLEAARAQVAQLEAARAQVADLQSNLRSVQDDYDAARARFDTDTESLYERNGTLHQQNLDLKSNVSDLQVRNRSLQSLVREHRTARDDLKQDLDDQKKAHTAANEGWQKEHQRQRDLLQQAATRERVANENRSAAEAARDAAREEQHAAEVAQGIAERQEAAARGENDRLRTDLANAGSRNAVLEAQVRTLRFQRSEEDKRQARMQRFHPYNQ